jgi:integrase/recombinase XerD
MPEQGSTGTVSGKQVSGPGTGKPPSALQAKMREQMTEKGLAEATQDAYVRAVLGLVRHYDRRPPAAISVAEARAYVASLKETEVSDTLRYNASAGIRFLYETTLGRVWRPISALRRRMLEDMALRGFTEKTQSSYVRAVEGLARYHNRAPDTLSGEDIRRYFVHLKCERKLARPTITIALCGIKFLWESTLQRDFTVTGIPRPKREHHLPIVLTREEVRAILRQITEVRHRACLSLIYACGLRLGEGCRVQVSDLDRKRGVVHIQAAKGAKDRYVPLPAPVLPLLETCWRLHRNPVWLFPSVGRGGLHGATATCPVPLGTVQQVFRAALAVSGVHKHVSVHSLRHSYATHLLEDGVNLRQIQTWLGHNSPAVTSVYTHLTEQATSAAAQQVGRLMQGLAPSTGSGQA